MRIQRPFPIQVLSALVLFFTLAMACPAQQPLPPRVVDLTAPDGVKLKASYFAAAKPGPGMILLHQCNRQRKVWDDLAGRLAAAGVNVVTVDLRGYGESEGTPIDKLSDEEIGKVFREKFPADIATAYHYLVTQPGVTAGAVAVGGASCGVNQSVQLARLHPEVKALVLLSEGTNAEGRAFLRKRGDMPMFLAVAADDPDPGVVEIMQWLGSLSTNPTNRFESYEKGGHGVEMFAAHAELEGEIVAWVSAVLQRGPMPAAGGAPPKPTQETKFLDAIDQPGGPAKAMGRYAEARKQDPKTQPFSEGLMNRIGYEHLQQGDVKGGVELLKLNVAAYPNSPNVYDSVSDAYLADGQKELARANAQKAIELLATDTTDPEDRRKGIRDNAEQKLKQLGTGPQ